MKSFIFFLLLISSYSFSQTVQPDMVIPITVTFFIPPYPEPYTGEYLKIGLDSTATDSIDAHLGEFILPLLPPPGNPAYFIIPSGPKVSRDFRFGEAPFFGQKTHRIKYLLDYLPVIHWILPDGVSGHLRDLFGGIFIDIDMHGTGSYDISYPLDELEMTIIYSPILPAELTSFSAATEGKSVKLKWITASEKNNSGFEIQRSAANGQWITTAFIRGKGTTTEIQSYTYSDEGLPAGKYSYRLKQIDYDGSFKYSDAVHAEIFPEEFSLMQNFPNPFNSATVIKYSLPENSFVHIDIFNTTGEKVFSLINEEQSPGTHAVIFNAANLPSGIYYYKAAAGEYSETKKMILMK